MTKQVGSRRPKATADFIFGKAKGARQVTGEKPAIVGAHYGCISPGAALFQFYKKPPFP